MKNLLLEAAAELYEEQDFAKLGHPYLTYAKFVFTDDQPNGNKQGVKYEDFPLLAKSAIDMPVKLRFLGKTIGNHASSVPIGHIKEIEENTIENGVHQLVAIAALYSNEYPNEIKYLKDSYDKGEAPSVSWELGYDRDEVENGITWKRKPIAKASTFVRQGAYGTRTKLLALASLEGSEEELGKELVALASTLGPNNGGITVDEKKEQEYKDKIASLEKDIAALTATHVKTDGDLKTAVAELQAKDEVIQQYEQVIVTEERTKKVVEAGLKLETDPAKLKTKQEFWAALPEATFDEYVADLKTAVDSAKPKAATAYASLQTRLAPTPRLQAVQDAPTTLSELATRLRSISRPSASNE